MAKKAQVRKASGGRKKSSRKTWDTFFRRLIMGVAAVFILMLIRVWCKIETRVLAVETTALRREQKEIEERNQVLRAQLVEITSYDYIKRRAARELRFTFPKVKTLR